MGKQYTDDHLCTFPLQGIHKIVYVKSLFFNIKILTFIQLTGMAIMLLIRGKMGNLLLKNPALRIMKRKNN